MSRLTLPRRLPPAVITALIFLLLLPPMLSIGLRRGMNHDESQHLAAGVVFGRHGLLPYRDFPYFHMPDLVFIYGALYRVCGSVLLPARIFSALAGWLTLAVIAWLVHRAPDGSPPWVRWLAPVGPLLLLMACPVFRDTYWRTWNHALATLFGLGAVGFALHAKRLRDWFWCGLLIGLAAGTRLTFAPLWAPLAAAALAAPGTTGGRVRRLGSYTAGSAMALLPTLALFAMAPAQFLFGNLAFNSKINVLFRQSYHDPRITPAAKMAFLKALLLDRGNEPLWMLFTAVLIAALLLRGTARRGLWLLLATIPFAMAGALAPSPSQHEYYYPLAVLMALGLGLAIAAIRSPAWAGAFMAISIGWGGVALGHTWGEYGRFDGMISHTLCAPAQIHAAGVDLRGWVGSGRVLTLDPVPVLEGGLDIYPELVTGVISWRTEHFVPPAERQRLRMLGPDNLAAAMAADPPAGVITSSAADAPLASWAGSHGYTPHPLAARGKLIDAATLWTP